MVFGVLKYSRSKVSTFSQVRYLDALFWQRLCTNLSTSGTNVRMSACDLRERCMPADAIHYLATAMTPAGDLVGHCLMSQW
jgi:hypothetical protein